MTSHITFFKNSDEEESALVPALGLGFLNEPESCNLHGALCRKALTCDSSVVTQKVGEHFRCVHPVLHFKQLIQWMINGRGRWHMSVRHFRCILISTRGFGLWAGFLATKIPSFDSCRAETAWHIVIQDVMYFLDSSPVTQMKSKLPPMVTLLVLLFLTSDCITSLVLLAAVLKALFPNICTHHFLTTQWSFVPDEIRDNTRERRESKEWI